MGNNEKIPAEDEKESQTLKEAIENDDDWSSFRDDAIIQQQDAIHAEAAKNSSYVGDKQPLSALAAEYQSGSPVIPEKIMVLGESFSAIRRTRGDGKCFFRCFMFAYLEHILESKDKAEVDRIKANVEQCKKTLMNLGYTEFTFEDLFAAANYIEYDTNFSKEEKKQSKALKVSCNLNKAACKLKLNEYKQAGRLCTKVLVSWRSKYSF